MNIQDVLAIRSLLRDELGNKWLDVLLKALRCNRMLFCKTHWASTRGTEANFVRRLAFPAALYFQIHDMPDMSEKRALQITERLILALGFREQWEHLKSLHISEQGGMS